MGVLVDSWLMMKVVLILAFILINSAKAAQVQNLKWEVEYQRWSPDGTPSVVMTINGAFPGPTIRARAGDTINLELINKLHTEGVVIHWHGITQRGTPWADGTASISQCPINPGESFVYKFNVDKAGTYFYHGHYGMQRSAGLYGMLIVDVAEGEKEKFNYDDERELLLSDWWHRGSREQEVDLSSNPMHWIGEPQTLLMNGTGQFGCSLAAEFSKSAVPCDLKDGEKYAPHVIKVDPNKTYRLRIASSTALASLNLAIGHHKMTVVEADGNYVEPFDVDNMDIYSGESYSVLITTNQSPSQNYWINATVRGREPKTPPALGILSYLPVPVKGPPILPISPTPVAPKWDDYAYSKAFSKKILAAAGSPAPPPKQDRRIVLLNTQHNTSGFIKWSINNISLALTSTPYLGAIKYNLTEAFDHTSPPDHYSPLGYDVWAPPPNPNTKSSSGIYVLRFGSTVDVVLQNANALTPKVSEIHPWHLHGHDFWVLGYGEGKFEKKDEANFNLKNPPLRNTAVIFPHGWTALRFVADNPGVWAFHCHIEPHLHMGMGVVFAEGVHRLGAIPNEALACGLTAKYLMKK